MGGQTEGPRGIVETREMDGQSEELQYIAKV